MFGSLKSLHLEEEYDQFVFVRDCNRLKRNIKKHHANNFFVILSSNILVTK